MTAWVKLMHDIRFIREHPDDFDRALTRRNLRDEDRKRYSSQRILSIDEHRRAIIRVLESWQARRNAASKAIGQAKAKKDDTEVQRLMTEVVECKTSISRLEAEEKAADERLYSLLAEIPNLPLDDVPDGKDEKDNVGHHHFGAKRDYAFTPKQHFDIGEALGQMDFETAAKLSGARFVVLKKGLARLERALGQFFLDVHTGKHGYTEVAPPLLVRDDVMFGTAQLPKFTDDQFDGLNAQRFYFGLTRAVVDAFVPRQPVEFRNAFNQAIDEFDRGELKDQDIQRRIDELLQAPVDVSKRLKFRDAFNQAIDEFDRGEIDDDEIQLRIRRLMKPVTNNAMKLAESLWLIPTAEVPLTNLVRESILDEAQLPLRYTACTPCFRAEAGAAGKDTRGMIRQHQFTKVELVSIAAPEQSKDEHERMLACAEEVLKKLELHYRVMTLCTGDMGFASQKTYDIEVWLPGQNMYREISSCSICGEFQARRMNARYRTKEGRNVRHVHTLNGSGVAVGRALIAVMENYQQEDGSIAVPEALAPYMGGMKKIAKGE
jgi:seryl-tRNA synthetase